MSPHCVLHWHECSVVRSSEFQSHPCEINGGSLVTLIKPVWLHCCAHFRPPSPSTLNTAICHSDTSYKKLSLHITVVAPKPNLILNASKETS